jgi:hypothetical protein
LLYLPRGFARLRPLSGNKEEIIGIFRHLNLETLEAATFPHPTPDSIKDHSTALLLIPHSAL